MQHKTTVRETPEASVAEQIRAVTGCTIEKAQEIADASAPLWRALEPYTDGYGGAEWARVLPVAIATIYHEANLGPFDESWAR